MTHLFDGNAIAGDLFAALGREMTEALGKCGNCETVSPVGELCVYARASGAVVRCSSCDAVVMVVATIGGEYLVHLPARFSQLTQENAGSQA